MRRRWKGHGEGGVRRKNKEEDEEEEERIWGKEEKHNLLKVRSQGRDALE